jgi:hypothetical protein
MLRTTRTRKRLYALRKQWSKTLTIWMCARLCCAVCGRCYLPLSLCLHIYDVAAAFLLQFVDAVLSFMFSTLYSALSLFRFCHFVNVCALAGARGFGRVVCERAEPVTCTVNTAGACMKHGYANKCMLSAFMSFEMLAGVDSASPKVPWPDDRQGRLQ